MPEISDDVKRQAVEAARGAKVNAEMSTLQPATSVSQPKLDPQLADLDTSRVPDWRDTKGMDDMREQKRDMIAPGE